MTAGAQSREPAQPKSALWSKLQQLSTDLGARRRNLRSFLKDELCALWNIRDNDPPAAVFAKVVWQLERLIEIAESKDERRLVLRVSFNIAHEPDVEPKVKRLMLMSRRQWLEDKGIASVSTSQRILNDALDRYEEGLEDSPPPPVPDEVVASMSPGLQGAAPGQPAPPERPRLWKPLLIGATAGLLALALFAGGGLLRAALTPASGQATGLPKGAPNGSFTPVSVGPAPDGLKTYREQQGSLGVDTYNDPFSPSITGIRMTPFQWVEVSCKVYSPVFDSLKPDGYWYRIASSPWNNEWYAAANTFMHGETSPPWKIFTDRGVPDCEQL